MGRRQMREDLIRGSFSFLAAAVFLGTSSEWFSWALRACSERLTSGSALQQRAPWKLIPAVVLLGFSVYEARKVWTRGERLLGLTS